LLGGNNRQGGNSAHGQVTASDFSDHFCGIRVLIVIINSYYYRSSFGEYAVEVGSPQQVLTRKVVHVRPIQQFIFQMGKFLGSGEPDPVKSKTQSVFFDIRTE
jgi:hypothetical protein